MLLWLVCYVFDDSDMIKHVKRKKKGKTEGWVTEKYVIHLYVHKYVRDVNFNKNKQIRQSVMCVYVFVTWKTLVESLTF